MFEKQLEKANEFQKAVVKLLQEKKDDKLETAIFVSTKTLKQMEEYIMFLVKNAKKSGSNVVAKSDEWVAQQAYNFFTENYAKSWITKLEKDKAAKEKAKAAKEKAKETKAKPKAEVKVKVVEKQKDIFDL